MSLWRPFHEFPCLPVFQPHRKNVLICPPGVLARLQEEGAMRLRQRADEILYEKDVRALAQNELTFLEKKITSECETFRNRIKEAENILSDPELQDMSVSDDVDTQKNDERSKDTESKFDQSSNGGRKRYWIAACDPSISFVDDFRGEFVDTMYNSTQMWSFSFGQWYNRLKRYLYSMPRWKRVYKISQVESLSISNDLLMGVINAVEQITVNPAHYCVVTDLEAAACILAAYQGAVDRDCNLPNTVDGVLGQSAKILRLLAEDLANELALGASANMFVYKDKPKMRFYTPSGKNNRCYPSGTFDEHGILSILFRRGAIISLSGSSNVGAVEVMEKISGVGKNDLLSIWTHRLLKDRLGPAVPFFLQEQDYLRSGLTAVMALILLWRILNSESVFTGKGGRFSLKDIFFDSYDESVENDKSEQDFLSGKIKNFEFLMDKYIIPFYKNNPSVTMSQLCPGLMLLAYCESHRSGWNLERPTHESTEDQGGSAMSSLRVQSSKTNPLIDYMMLQSTKSSDKDVERLAAHDYVLFHCENGLGRFLSLSLPKHRVLSLGSHLFNVHNVYECIYFFVLGFLPVVNVTS